MHAKTSMDEKLSDLVGSADYKINDRFSLNYNFSIDQNYNDFNYSEAGMALSFDSLKVNFNYLEERKHIGDQDYLKSKLGYENNKTSKICFDLGSNFRAFRPSLIISFKSFLSNIACLISAK